MKLNIYLAGPLFTAAERAHNRKLANQLRKLGRTVTVPQNEAVKFIVDGKADLPAIRKDCKDNALNPNNICVANLDGTTADDGTVFEFAGGVIVNGRAVTYRTDFRTAPEKEVGVNAMLMDEHAKHIYKPAFYTSGEEEEKFYEELAAEIDAAICEFEKNL